MVTRHHSHPTEFGIGTEADANFIVAGGRFDLGTAEGVRTFFRRFPRQSQGEWTGQPFERLEWLCAEIIAPLYDWLGADGTPRFRRGVIEVSHPNDYYLSLAETAATTLLLVTSL